MTGSEQSMCKLPEPHHPAAPALAPEPDASMHLPTLFQQGLTWPAFLEANNGRAKDLMLNVLERLSVPASLLMRLKARKPIKILSFGETWCPDVIHHFPIIALLERVLDNIEARFISSEAHASSLERLSGDGKKSIPLILFFDADFKEFARIRGRKPLARDWMKTAMNGRKPPEIAEPEKESITQNFIDGFLGEFIRETWQELDGHFVPAPAPATAPARENTSPATRA
jgi:thioredoxin family protein